MARSYARIKTDIWGSDEWDSIKFRRAMRRWGVSFKEAGEALKSLRQHYESNATPPHPRHQEQP